MADVLLDGRPATRDQLAELAGEDPPVPFATARNLHYAKAIKLMARRRERARARSASNQAAAARRRVRGKLRRRQAIKR